MKWWVTPLLEDVEGWGGGRRRARQGADVTSY